MCFNKTRAVFLSKKTQKIGVSSIINSYFIISMVSSIKIFSLKTLIIFVAFFTAELLFSQSDFLAKQYFSDGDFKKAVVHYKKLVDKNPRRSDYSQSLIECYQQLGKYILAEEFLLRKIKDKYTPPTLIIELGYNYSLQGFPKKALKYYNEALLSIDKNTNYSYGIGLRFHKYVLLDYVVMAFTKAMRLNPKLDYNFQLARIYGEQGNIEKMYKSYLVLIQKGKTSKSNVLRNIGDFISSDALSENNITFKKVLLRNAQKNPDILWNELLSWLFIQQNQYANAFNQEKAIYRRDSESSMQRMESLGKLTLEHKVYGVAKSIFKYIVEYTTNDELKLNTQLSLIYIELLNADEKKLAEVHKTYKELLSSYGYGKQSLHLQVAYAKFLTFKKDSPELGIAILKKGLKILLNSYEKAYIKMALGDILVYHQKFNQALIYFSQIQKNLKNDVIGQNARFKVAQTSFYKGDFDWAMTQLKVLRSSTSQLIANDAMQLSLLISDNSLEDSTQTALKKYAHADLLAFQNKTKEAVLVLDDILQNHKGEKIEDEALLKQGKLLEMQNDYNAAKFNYRKIIEFYGSDILVDDAYFALAELYKNILNEPVKAMEHYEKIIYNYQDSYYFPEARKNYRLLRGDIIN